MADQGSSPGRRDACILENGEQDEVDYVWAEFNLPAFPALHHLFGDDAGDELAFIGFAQDADPQAFGNS